MAPAGSTRFAATLRRWLPLALAVTALCALSYLAVQQSYRMSLNDPQIQLAEDGARALAAGVPPEAVAGTGTVDVAESLAPWVEVVGESGTPVVSSGLLDGAPVKLPPGVFEYTRAHGEDRVSWQPRPSVRGAVVVVHSNATGGGFVVVGRSMREVEARIDQLTRIVALGWLVTLAATFISVWVFWPRRQASRY